MTRTDVSNPTPACRAQYLHFEPNTGVYNPTPDCTTLMYTTHLLRFEPNAGVYSPMPVNCRWRGSGGNPVALTSPTVLEEEWLCSPTPPLL